MIEDLLQEDYTQTSTLLKLSFIFFVIIFLRYLLVSACMHYFLHVVFKTKLSNRIINEDLLKKDQLIREVFWSGVTSLIFTISSIMMIIAWQKGLTALYISWSAYSLWYLPFSLLAALFLHDTYYYWLHRWMHYSRRIYHLIHKTHHESIITTALTSFSFHPFESILQAIFIPALVFFLPMHISVLLTLLVIMTLSGTINHAGAELYSISYQKSNITNWIIGASHHDIHHKKFNHNYGLYFTFWDRWMGTEYKSENHLE